MCYILGVGAKEQAWWNEFETNLGNVTEVKGYAEMIGFENQPIFTSDDSRDWYSDSASIEVDGDLGVLIDEIKGYFQLWASALPAGDDKSVVRIETEQSFFLTFNYSRTLERLYGIPEEQILHIHGCSSQRDSIVVGHGRSYEDIRFDLNNDSIYSSGGQEDDIPTSQAKDAAADAIYEIHKDVTGIIEANSAFFQSLDSVEKVHIYGFSFAETDLPYIDTILNNVDKEKVMYEVSWFSLSDKDRVIAFFDSRSLLGQVTLMRLEDIERYTMPGLF